VRANNLKAYECDIPSDEEVARREVRRIVDTLKEQAARLTPEERAEYETMARGILDEAERLSIIAYLLKTHFEEEAAKGVLDEAPGPATDVEAAARPAQSHGHHAPPSGPGGAPGEGTGFRRRRRRRRGRGGHGGAQGGAPAGGG
jgi:hypothetical protein